MDALGGGCFWGAGSSTHSFSDPDLNSSLQKQQKTKISYPVFFDFNNRISEKFLQILKQHGQKQ
jgi:hypothetical protein